LEDVGELTYDTPLNM